jgi:CRISPR system Cascade subunit CasE
MTLIASTLRLNRRDITALRITDPYSLHRVVYSLYDDVRSDDDKIASQTSGILYADQGGNRLERTILLLGDRKPADRIDGQYGEINSRAISAEFLQHPRYRFKVIVNPTRRDNRTGKLVPVKGREAIAEWFCQRAPSWGFDVSVPHLQVERQDVLQFHSKQQHLITIAQAHVHGQLQVTDSALFMNSFRLGIGRGRAFGCGLLQVVPLFDTPLASIQ